jgi:hypothetical protein
MPELYGLVQTEDVMKTIENAGPAKRPLLWNSIWALQQNPRPEGHEATDAYVNGLAKLVVNQIDPPYHIVYQVDEQLKRVTVLAVYEMKWN